MSSTRSQTAWSWGPILHRVGSLDLRSLAIFRMAVGLILIGDLIARLPYLTNDYTDLGWVPRSIMHPASGHYSLHMLSGAFGFQLFMFVAAGVAAFLLMLGYKTRAMTVVSWFLLLSLQHRNPHILFAFDVLMRCAMFWAMFLPWGRVWSLDARGRQPPEDTGFTGAITWAFMFQIVFVYVFTMQHKTGAEWNETFKVLEVVMLNEQIGRPWARGMLEFPAMLSGMSWVVAKAWLLMPLVLMPFLTHFFRTILCLLLISCHMGILLMVRMDPFPYLSSAVMIALLPSSFWDRVLPKLRLGVVERKIGGFFAWLGERLAPPRESTWVKRVLEHKLLGPLPLVRDFLVVGLLGWTLLWNLSKVSTVPAPSAVVGRVTGLTQRWAMFAPTPYRPDGWMIVSGRLADGRVVELFHGRDEIQAAMSEAKPDDIYDLYERQRTRKYFNKFNAKRRRHLPRAYSKYHCGRWNDNHDAELQIDRIDIFKMNMRIEPKRAPIINKIFIGAYRCPDGTEIGSP